MSVNIKYVQLNTLPTVLVVVSQYRIYATQHSSYCACSCPSTQNMCNSTLFLLCLQLSVNIKYVQLNTHLTVLVVVSQHKVCATQHSSYCACSCQSTQNMCNSTLFLLCLQLSVNIKYVQLNTLPTVLLVVSQHRICTTQHSSYCACGCQSI